MKDPKNSQYFGGSKHSNNDFQMKVTELIDSNSLNK
jgi:hypothetical protein